MGDKSEIMLLTTVQDGPNHSVPQSCGFEIESLRILTKPLSNANDVGVSQQCPESWSWTKRWYRAWHHVHLSMASKLEGSEAEGNRKLILEHNEMVSWYQLNRDFK